MPVNKGKMAKALGIGTAAALVLIVLLLCAVAGVLKMTPSIPTGALPYMMMAVTAVGTLLGGYITAAIAGSKGLVMGLCCGLTVFLLLLIIGMSKGTGDIGALTFVRSGVCALCGVLGGIKGVNRREKLHIK